MKSKYTFFALLAPMLIGSANAALFVNFGAGNGNNQAVGAGNAAGINASTSWIDSTLGTNATGVTDGSRTVTWASTGTWGGSAAGGTLSGDDALMNTWLDGGASVTLTGLTIGDTITVYGTSDNGNAGRSMGWSLDGSDVLATGTFGPTLNGNGDYFDGFGTGSADEYTFVATATTHTLSDHSAGTGTVRSPFAGIEVVDFVPVPEPSSTALLGLGGLALILRRRK